MLYSKLLFDKDEFKIVTKRLKELAFDLANKNGFPIKMWFDIKKDDVKDLVNYFSKGIDNFGINNLVEVIKKDKPTIIFLSKDDKEKINKEKLINNIIMNEIHNYFLWADSYISVDLLKSPVFKKFKEICLDKYNLITIDDDFELKNHGIIYKQKFLLYYHQFLRRGYNSNFIETTALLSKLVDNKDISIQVALDPFRMAHPRDYKDIFEFDYWWGAKFNLDKMNDDKFTGLTVHKRVNNHSSLLSFPIDRTEFLVSNKDGRYKEIQIEEIHLEKVDYSKKYYLHKYAHIIWDKITSTVMHFDVAVKVYTPNEYKKRITYNWRPHQVKDEAKTVEKIKLFRLDGKFDFKTTLELLSYFFRDNELIHEYFEYEQ